MNTQQSTHATETEVSLSAQTLQVWQAFSARGSHSEQYEQTRRERIAALGHAIAEQRQWNGTEAKLA